MKTLELMKATASLVDYVRHMGKGPVVFTERRKPLVVGVAHTPTGPRSMASLQSRRESADLRAMPTTRRNV